jgi:hypothetical protein
MDTMPIEDRPTPVGMPRSNLHDMKTAHRPLPQDSSIEQLVHALNEGMRAWGQLASDSAKIASDYASLASECKSLLAEIPERLELAYAEARSARGVAEDVAAQVVLMEVDLQDVKARLVRVEVVTGLKPAPLPNLLITPMRTKSQSNNDLARHVSKAAMADIEAIRRNPSTPPGPISSELQEKIFEERVSAGLAIRDAARLQKAEETRIAREEKEEEDAREARKADLAIKRDLKVRTWIAILAILTTIATIIATQMTRNASIRQAPIPATIST